MEGKTWRRTLVQHCRTDEQFCLNQYTAHALTAKINFYHSSNLHIAQYSVERDAHLVKDGDYFNSTAICESTRKLSTSQL